MTVAFRALVAGVAAVGLLAASQATYAQEKTIKIGALFPMSGPGSYFGGQDKQGVELALEQLNKDGVNGYKFVVQYEDSSCAPWPATQGCKRRAARGFELRTVAGDPGRQAPDRAIQA